MGPAVVDPDFAGGEGPGEVELVGGHEDGAALGRGRRDDLVEDLAAFGIEPGVGLVEQEERGTAHQGRAEGEPAALAGGELGVGEVGHRAEAEPVDHRIRVVARRAADALATKRRFSRTVRSS